jgi:membrane protein YqaA with SNARE-associated domain
MRWFIPLFASPIGIIVLAALDSTLFFAFPLGIDAAVILLAARMAKMWWVVPLLAATGSLAGTALTFWMGRKIGATGLSRYILPKRLNRVRAKIRDSGVAALAALDLIPPPFPFTPFVLAAGALDVNRSVFFVALVLCRLLRFGLEAGLAWTYGPRVLALLDSELFQNVIAVVAVCAVGLTICSGIRLFRLMRAPSGRAFA